MKKFSKEETNNSQLVTPKVSIVVPVYNVEEYLPQCLDSILAQTFQDFELILVNDGSNDKSNDICEEYAKKDSRIRVFHQINQGQAVARNKGVELAKAEWILFIDSDDVVHSQMAEYLYTAVVETQADVITCMRVQGEAIPKDFLNTYEFQYFVKKIDEEELINLYKEKSHIYWALFPALIKKEIVKKIKFRPGKIYEDNALTCQWLYEAGSITVIPQVMYFYRNNPSSTMNRLFGPKTLDYLWALRTQIEFFSTIQYKRLFDIICKEYIRATLWMCKQIDAELRDEHLKKEVLRKTEKVCKKYRQDISQYHCHMRQIDRMLHPYKYRIKKKLGFYRE